MNWKDIHHSPSVRAALATLGIVIILLVVFKLGEGYGFHRAHFLQKYGDNFHRNFIDPRDTDARGWVGSDRSPGGHGAVGKVVSVALPKITVAGPDNHEKTIVVTDSTLIRKFSDTTTNNEIHVGDYVVVLGEPNESGEVEAQLIRIVPPPPTTQSPGTTPLQS